MEARRQSWPSILVVHSSDEMYGADFVLLRLVCALSARGFRPIVVLPTDVPYTGELSKALQENDIEIHHADTAVLRRKYFTPKGVLLYLWKLVKSTMFLAQLIRRESVSIVHSNTAAVIPGALAARLTGRHHVWHVHEIITSPRLLWRLTSWLLPRLSDQVVAVSNPTQEHLCLGDRRNVEKTTVIHNGIQLQRFDGLDDAGRSIRGEWGVADGQPLIGVIGRLSIWKGQAYFLRVASIVARSYPSARFCLVGGTFPGQEQLIGELEALAAQLGLSSSLTISGFRSDIPAVLNALDILVLPSIQPDPFPTTVLEAMAARKPVVANAHGGSVEMIRHNVTGMLVEPGRPESMARAILHLLDDPSKRRTMGAQARERLVARFSLEAFTEKWVELYASLEPGAKGSHAR